MRRQTMACLLALTAGDYALWHWSLDANHDVLALLAGLTLLPLVVISAGALLLSAMGLLARTTRASSKMTSSMRATRTTTSSMQASRDTQPAKQTRHREASGTADDHTPPPSSSRRLAA